ncbi:3-carboxy-cis,cis-muconate cycloisomerase [Sphingomonas sp. Leaf339]|uniref:lyase family protein n=1 Tax=Sphingomonas sp. Leaf339 TaxID=1736343 RepID=UPI00070153E2|nr:lyase family protein [Sphingomonas sp. Leaf339]KQU48101.1 3-carboxy-cis,cis-muconate cycloisomerase [Sphingomonas sp. Leaf339]
MTDLLRSRPVATPTMLAVFDDNATICHALAFEAALSRAEVAVGLIAADVGQAIADACTTLAIDPVILADEMALAGTLAIPLVARLRTALTGSAAEAVHKGATSQDVADTVLMMQIRAGATLLLADLDRATAALRDKAARHAETPAIGRTLLQDAMPVAFGLRFAHWMAGIGAAAERLRTDVVENACVQFGGAAGTRAGLDGKGAAVAARIAADLGLARSEPWHARRIGIAAIGSSLGIVIGALGKMARDISLLSQNAVGEASEPAVAGRGGSSAMAHKRNPTGCQVALSAATRAPGLAAALLGGLPQEQERGLGGWQAEGPVIADLFLLASGAAAAMADVAEGLEINEAAIARNLDSAGFGTDIGESVAIACALITRYER